MMMSETVKIDAPKYLVTYSKQTAALGEVIQVQTNMPEGTTTEDMANEFIKIGNALDIRMVQLNEKNVARTGKTLEALGIEIPGFNKVQE
jgi:hypothetical protein